VYKRQIYQIAESNRIEAFLPELECSSADQARVRAVSATGALLSSLGVNRFFAEG